MRRLVLTFAVAAGSALAALPILMAHSVERLPNGNTLMVDGGRQDVSNGRAFEVDSLGRLVWCYLKSDVSWTHTARRLANGNTLISASNADKVLEVSPNGDSVWAMTTGLNYPNEAFRLDSGLTLITDRDNSRVIAVDSVGTIHWEYTALLHPHNGHRLPNGNTLICDSDRNRVTEVNPAGTIVWQKTGLNWPRCAQRLPGFHTLIADTRNNRVIEIDSLGAVTWSVLNTPAYTADRLANGNTLISSARHVIEVNPTGEVVWEYPQPGIVVTETLWVRNSTSGCSLYTHIHRPVYATGNRRVPGVVLVPGGNGQGTSYDATGLADDIASDGLAVLHFDPDGRGLSSPYPENYNGHVHQDGMRACARELAARDYIDTSRLGIYSQSYGITMASGMLARYPARPAMKFLLDFEGPADRTQTCQDSGGHVPVPPDSESFWLEREAARFMKQAPVAYLRFQTITDHNPRITDNRHAIALIDSTTGLAHGGRGISPWTRVNDSTMNPANQTYTLNVPPQWIPEIQEYQSLPRTILYLHELARLDLPTAFTENRDSPYFSTGLVFSPNPCRGLLTVRLAKTGTAAGSRPKELRVFDASGRLVRRFSLSHSAIRTPQSLSLTSLPDGAYFLTCPQLSPVPQRVVLVH
jgi:hypothetical protein